MARPPLTPEQRSAHITELDYHFTQMTWAAIARVCSSTGQDGVRRTIYDAIRSPSLNNAVDNALVESILIHARALGAYLDQVHAPGRDGNDLDPADICTGYHKPDPPVIAGPERNRLSRRLAHATNDASEREWPAELFQRVFVAANAFYDRIGQPIPVPIMWSENGGPNTFKPGPLSLSVPSLFFTKPSV